MRTGLELVDRTERLDLRLAGHLAPFFYWDESNLNSVDRMRRSPGQLPAVAAAQRRGGRRGAGGPPARPRRHPRTPPRPAALRRKHELIFSELMSASVSYGYTQNGAV